MESTSIYRKENFHCPANATEKPRKLSFPGVILVSLLNIPARGTLLLQMKTPRPGGSGRHPKLNKDKT